MVAISMTRLNIMQAICSFEEGQIFGNSQVRDLLPDVTSQMLTNHLTDLATIGAITRVAKGKWKFLDKETLLSYIELEYESNTHIRAMQPCWLIPDDRVREMNGAVNTAEALMAAGIPLYRHYRNGIREVTEDAQRELDQLKRNSHLKRIHRKTARHTLLSVPREDILETMQKHYPNSWEAQMEAYDKFMGGN